MSSIGETLREARHQKKVSLEDVKYEFSDSTSNKDGQKLCNKFLNWIFLSDEHILKFMNNPEESMNSISKEYSQETIGEAKEILKQISEHSPTKYFIESTSSNIIRKNLEKM